ncbi:MAG TPA: phosphoribosylformylglycinamidine synthase subunit PurL [Thermoplasmatales archaeon]|nr:phosphoribosylformylglycinamidine synthase subunit PurL [Thermoplasmatales archaeon]
MEKLLKKRDVPFELYEIDILNANDDDLLEISRELGLALSLLEMQRIKKYFQEKGRNPTDVELQALGQAWSEHCCYKSSKVPLKKYLFDIEKERIVAREDAGVMEFDEGHYYVVALESHNHPSAIEPYGGAATGIGGIVRDVVCMGAQPIAFIDPLFFGPLDYEFDKLPKGTKHPRYLFKGVVDGIRDYGNRIGIPTVAGQVVFHEGYVGNCLVNVGCIGIMKKKHLVHSRAKAPGNIFVYVGGKTGRDGIHGVTFASEELKEESETESRSAVQVGDPILKEPLIHVTLECVEKGLLEGLKDFGGGGLSCVSSELAHAAGLGAEIYLDKIPLKEEGMAPWEIWVSESQERMMFLVNEENLEKVLHICKKWDVFAAPVGRVIGEKVIRVFYKGIKVLELDADFQTSGPIYDLCTRPLKIREKREAPDPEFDLPDLYATFRKVLSSQNISSRDWVIRQYDHEVRGNTVIKPLQGVIGKEGHGDAAVLKPLEESFKGIAVTADVNPKYLEIDPYWGACSAVDEVCRNLVSVGAKPDSIADCLNFGNPEKPEVMGDFYEACRGLGDMAKELRLPFISGNVSFYNESVSTSIPPTPQLTGVGLIPDVRKCTTADFKAENSLIYLIGKTKKELGGSEYYRVMKLKGGSVPKPDVKLLKRCIDTLTDLIWNGYIIACHDLSEGGLAIAVAESCIAGDIGARIDINKMKESLREDFKLFSESNTRWIIEVEEGKAEHVEKALSKSDIPFAHIGKTGGKEILFLDGDRELIKIDVSDARDVWKKTIWEFMG